MTGMKILLLLLLQTSQFFQIVGFQVESVYYHHNGILCTKCPSGHKITNHCTKEYHNSDCVPCEEGTYAVKPSSSEQCGKCKDCRHTDQIIKNNCTPERDTECQCPDKKYFDLDFCKNCEAPRVKRVKNDKEYCEDCENGYYYNNTKEDCVKCDICTKHQVILQNCNVTHNAVCQQIPTTSPSTVHMSNTVSSADKNEDGLSDGGIAGIVIIIIIIIVGLIIIIICKKKKMYCFREKENGKKDEEVGQPLTDSTTRDVQSSQPSQSKVNDNGAGAHLIENGDLAEQSKSSHEPIGRKYSETQNSLPQFEEFDRSSKPEWLIRIGRILIDNVDTIDVFASSLGYGEFKARTKWIQLGLDGKSLESRFYEFMFMWYEKTIDPSLEKIISVLQSMNKNDIIDIVKNDDNLKQQLNKRRVSSDDHTVQSDNQCKRKHPIQASDDGHVDYPDKYRHSNLTDSLDNRQISSGLAQNTSMACPSGTRPQHRQNKEMTGEQWTNPKKLSMESNTAVKTVVPSRNITLKSLNVTEHTQPKEIDGPDSDEDQTNPKQFLVEC